MCVLLDRYLDRSDDEDDLRKSYTDYQSLREEVLMEGEEVGYKAPLVIVDAYAEQTLEVLSAMEAVAVSLSNGKRVQGLSLWKQGVTAVTGPNTALHPAASAGVLLHCMSHTRAHNDALYSALFACLGLLGCPAAAAAVVLLSGEQPGGS